MSVSSFNIDRINMHLTNLVYLKAFLLVATDKFC
uniref:Uncharacterized protein n=1 Tax=Anguilla anguilla TaxID=7936 RepID=A0A0E9T850_ANGAN